MANYWLLILIILVLPLSYSVGVSDDDQGKVTEKDLDKLQDEGGIEGVKAENVEKTPDGNYRITSGGYTKGGVDYGGKNIVVNSDGEIIRADSLDVDGNHFENVQDFQRNSEGEYYVGSAERLQDGNRKLLSGKVITGKDDGLDAQQANSVMDENAVVYMVDGYSSSGDSFNLDSARKVIVDDTSFKDIKDSSFKTEDGDLTKADVTSAKDNNSFEVDDVKITLDKDESFNLTKSHGKYDISLDSDNGTVQDSGGNVACADISPGSRYRYVGQQYDDFGLYIPSDASKFNLCMRTEENEQHPTNCSQCGVMDFVNQSFVLNGNYEYERKDSIDPRLFTDVIKANGNFSGNLSENAEDVTHLYPGLGQVFSNIFEVKYWQEDEGFRFAGFNKPFTIEWIYPNINITEENLTYTA